MNRRRRPDAGPPPSGRLRQATRVLVLLLGLLGLASLVRKDRRAATPERPAPPAPIAVPERRELTTSPGRVVQGIRLLLVLIGLALLLRAGLLFRTTIKSSQWPEIAVWLAAGVLLHDALIAPITLLLARIVHPGPVLRAGWLGAGVCVLLAIPLLKGAMTRRNPTVIPYAPGPELLRALVVVVVGMLLAVVIARVRRPTGGGRRGRGPAMSRA